MNLPSKILKAAAFSAGIFLCATGYAAADFGNVEPPENTYTLYKPVVYKRAASGTNRCVETNTQLILPNMTVRKAAIKRSNFGGINGLLDGTRTIINVKEFVADAETKYFKLPTELKYVTKRKTVAKRGSSR